METLFWFIFFVSSLCLCVLIIFRSLLSPPHLPPGPLHLPIIGNILWLRKSFSQLEPTLRTLHAKHGPIITLHFLSTPNIFISDHTIAHHALIRNAAIFAHRPKSLSNDQQFNIATSVYGPTCRVLRRNLAAVSRFRSFSGIRKSVLHDLLNRLKLNSESRRSVKLIDHVRHAMFSLLLFMCFGERLDDEQIDVIKRVQRRSILSFSRMTVLNYLPRVVTRVFYGKRLRELLGLRKAQKEVLAQLIEKRRKDVEKKEPDRCGTCYMDTLVNLHLPEENRKLDEDELITLCSEFLNAGTDTTSTALEWVMANLVKYRHIQERLVKEIGEVVRDREEKEVKEEDLKKLPYLKAVVLEGLRRHPPSHYVLPHGVSDDVVFNGYLVPKKGTVNFMVAEMGWDPKVWEDPMAFKPERFLTSSDEKICEFDEAFDISGNKEIKMMPFGAGKRICPAYKLALLHLEYFVANLVWNFEWKVANGDSVIDLSEKQEFTMVMKHPLKAHICPRM